MNDIVIVSKNEYDIRKGEILFNGQDGQDLIEYQDVFKKFIEKARLSYQIELCKGTHRGKEEKLYLKMEACDELIKSLKDFQVTFKKYIKSIEK